MSNWAELLSNFFGEDSWQILAVALVFGFLTLIKGVADFAWNQKNRKIAHLKSALEIESLSDEVRFVLTEDINRSLFMKITGIASDQYTRQIYVNLLKKSKGELTINQLRRASQYLSFNNREISVDKSTGRKCGYFLDKWYPLVLVAAAIVQILVVIFDYNASLVAVQIMLVIGCLIMAGFLKRQSNNYEVALHIEGLVSKELEETEEDNNRVKKAA